MTTPVSAAGVEMEFVGGPLDGDVALLLDPIPSHATVPWGSGVNSYRDAVKARCGEWVHSYWLTTDEYVDGSTRLTYRHAGLVREP